jgi:hypothetical protein
MKHSQLLVASQASGRHSGSGGAACWVYCKSAVHDTSLRWWLHAVQPLLASYPHIQLTRCCSHPPSTSPPVLLQPRLGLCHLCLQPG